MKWIAPTYTMMGEPLGTAETAAGEERIREALLPLLKQRYPQLRFLNLKVASRPDCGLINYPDLDLIDVAFSLSGRREDLERCRFAHPDWIEGLPPCGVRNCVRTPGFGFVWNLAKNRSGTFRLRGARYDHALEILPLHTIVADALARMRAPREA